MIPKVLSIILSLHFIFCTASVILPKVSLNLSSAHNVLHFMHLVYRGIGTNIDLCPALNKD